MQNFNILAGLCSLASLVWVSHDEKYARQDIPRQSPCKSPSGDIDSFGIRDDRRISMVCASSQSGKSIHCKCTLSRDVNNGSCLNVGP